MSKIEQTQYNESDGIIYRLVLEPSGDVTTNMCHLQKGDMLSDNCNYSSHRAHGDIPMTGIVYINSNPTVNEVENAIKPFNPHYAIETMEDYLQKLENMNPINILWIKKIIEGTAEESKVLDRNNEFIVARDWKFDVVHNSESETLYKRECLHLLGIPIERIGSLRDIEPKHIPMLDAMKEKALKLCKNIFAMDRDEIKIYFHYPPSTYHLHVHYTWVGLNDITTNFERAYDYDTVVKNVKLNPDYYRDTMRYIKLVK